MNFPSKPEPIDLGEGSDPVEIRLACVNGSKPSGRHEYVQGLVIDFYIDPATGDAVYQLYVFDMPTKREQVELARKICAVEGAVAVDKGSGIKLDIEILRQALTAEEFRLLRCLTNSREAGNSLLAYVSLARLEGEEGYVSAKNVLDRDSDDDPTAGLSSFKFREDVTGEELHRLLVEREFPTT